MNFDDLRRMLRENDLTFLGFIQYTFKEIRDTVRGEHPDWSPDRVNEEAAIRTAMQSAAKDPRLWTGKAKVDDLIAEYLKGHATAGGGQGPAPTAAPAAAAPPPAKAAPALRAPSAAEQSEAQEWLAKNGDTPENRQYLNDQIKQRGLRPFL